MILHKLNDYYERKRKLGEIAPDGFIEKEIDFLIELDIEGNCIGITDQRQHEGKKLKGKRYHVPVIGKQALKHTNSANDANLLWDNSSFVLGIKKGDEENSEIKTAKRFKSFIEAIYEHYQDLPDDVKAILIFLQDIQKRLPVFPRDVKNVFEPVKDKPESFQECLEGLSSGEAIISFRVKPDIETVIEKMHVSAALDVKSEVASQTGICLVSGERAEIDSAHMVIKGISGAQTSGCSLVAFNKASFCSYGKKQSFNAPVSKKVSAAYVKALQTLIDSPRNKIAIPSMTMLFWAQEQEFQESKEIEEGFRFVMSPSDAPDKGAAELKAFLHSVKSGKYLKPMGDFYVLGLNADSKARLSVKYWDASLVSSAVERIEQHFDDFSIIHGKDEREYLPLINILRATVFEGKIDRISASLTESVLRSIMNGNDYPQTLFLQTILRIRATRKITRERAAILKACVNRSVRLKTAYFDKTGEIQMALDKTNTNCAYRLGRLFAVLEKIQGEALPGLNATIRDRFYGAASSSPVLVFPRLLKLSKHHLSQLGIGRRIQLEELLGEIISDIRPESGFPKQLPLPEQGLFAIGYYHQRTDLYTKKDKS